MTSHSLRQREVVNDGEESRFWFTTVTAICTLTAALCTSSAYATFPDANGKIAIEGRGISTINPDGTGLTRLTTSGARPSFSADGTKITYQSNVYEEGHSNSEIFVMNADGTGVRRVTYDHSWNSDPSFSPDGDRIVFTSSRDYGASSSSGDVYTMNVDGTNVRRLTTNGAHDVRPSFSPDGTKIVYQCPVPGGGLGICVMNADGTNQTRLTGYGQGDPSWSPDGRQIAFSYTDGIGAPGLVAIYVMNADGSGRRRVTGTSGSWCIYPSWSPDGTKIVYALRNAGTAMYIVNADGTDNHSLTPTLDLSAGANSWGIVPGTMPPPLTTSTTPTTTTVPTTTTAPPKKTVSTATPTETVQTVTPTATTDITPGTNTLVWPTTIPELTVPRPPYIPPVYRLRPPLVFPYPFRKATLLSSGKVKLTLSGGKEGLKGKLTLKEATTVERPLTLGTKAVNIAPHKLSRVTVSISKKAAKQLKKSGALEINAVFADKNGSKTKPVLLKLSTK